MRIIYFISLITCGLILLVYLVNPFAIWDSATKGFYDPLYIQNIFGISNTKAFIYVNKFIGLIFWVSILLCLSLMLIKINKKKKEKIALACLITITFIILLPKIYHLFF
ncbi:hypothetical protein [Elizabethkingia anophelis]|uniref:hypothetical protein n=1 Tax=Elizabethkingia anophelis TaxID=1117645 RepID=UPI0021A7EBCD|nr:hypothetical protein [Elizabethkingia anophelis]MCT3925396.1 hypothetical protein [Elizabethkingia anophelis]MCT4100133.1 hypothetical protein [Elizabethkingia anophelis]MCT4164333.1 hypothetical protein [Elizabethkingia anophelis]MCW2464040.1 hypothetical protein [Elizabethkingia anophelis]MCW2467724.1 hypothetical protein [Elizabethkingia anophelis]